MTHSEVVPHLARLEVLVGLPELCLRVHDEGTSVGDGLVQRLAAHQQQVGRSRAQILSGQETSSTHVLSCSMGMADWICMQGVSGGGSEASSQNTMAQHSTLTPTSWLARLTLTAMKSPSMLK